MSERSLDVFALREAVVNDYRRFATSFTTIHAADIREQVDSIYANDRYWPEPLIQINPSYRRTTTVDRLVASGVLEPACGTIFSIAYQTRLDAPPAYPRVAHADTRGGNP